MFDVNATLIIFIVSFLLFVSLMNEVFIKPVGEVIEKRKKLIAADNEAAKSCREEARASLTSYEARLSEIRESAQAKIADAIASAQAERNKEIGALKDRSRKKLDESRKALTAERSALLEKLVEEEEALVKEIVGKLLSNKVSVSVNSQSIKRALEEAI